MSAMKRMLIALLAAGLACAACVSSAETTTTTTSSTTTTTTTSTTTTTTTTLAVGGTYLDPALPIDERVEDLLGRMTLAEKIGQMTQVEKNSMPVDDVAVYGIGSVLSGGGGSPPVNTPEAWVMMVGGFQASALRTRLAIPLIYGVDSVHGHANLYGATVFPQQIALGAANNPDLMEQIGRITAAETAATGIYWNFGPVVAVVQDIRWGRTYESYGEDPDLVASLATAYITGLQGDDLSERTTILATPKHFVGDGATTWGTSTSGDYMIDQGDAQIDEQTLRDVHLAPYIDAIEAGAICIMVSFSSWNGTKMHAHEYLITDVLKDELGFEGFVVSDWAGIDQISPDYYESVVAAINAGIDMAMVPYDYERFINTLTEAVEDGDVSIERIDDAVRRILRAKFALGLFENPYADPTLLDSIGSDMHRIIARAAVRDSLVLLKNDGDILPMGEDTGVVLVAGQAADDVGIQSGGWTIQWQGGEGDILPGTTILEGIERVAPEGATVYYNRAGTPQVHGEAVEPDVCIAVVGERPYAEGVGDDADLTLPDQDLAVLDNLGEACDRLGVVLVSGRPLIITDLIDDWDAVVAAWLPGSEGDGVAEVLFGVQGFSGTLPLTWPASVDQLPLGTETGEEPLFPFGYGLTTSEICCTGAP
jgi:beta-glucosidase